MLTEIQNPRRYRLRPKLQERRSLYRTLRNEQIGSLLLCYLVPQFLTEGVLTRLQSALVTLAVILLQSTLLFLASRNALDPAIPGWDERPNRWARAAKLMQLLLAITLLAHFAARAAHSLLS